MQPGVQDGRLGAEEDGQAAVTSQTALLAIRVRARAVTSTSILIIGRDATGAAAQTDGPTTAVSLGQSRPSGRHVACHRLISRAGGDSDVPSEATATDERNKIVKYVILIHSDPQPWGHPTDQLTDEAGRRPGVPRQSGHDFEALMEEINASGEFVTALALADPASSTFFGWSPEGHLRTDGPYAETKEQLAGFFLIDCATRERAEEIADRFAQPGGTIERRPSTWGADDDQ